MARPRAEALAAADKLYMKYPTSKGDIFGLGFNENENPSFSWNWDERR
jgi:hypothetical protein